MLSLKQRMGRDASQRMPSVAQAIAENEVTKIWDNEWVEISKLHVYLSVKVETCMIMCLNEYLSS